jgi:hypothetical protein
MMGASVLSNRHTPTTNEIVTAIPATDSIHIFMDGVTPGAISMVAIKKEKRSVEIPAEIQYAQERTPIL